MQGAILGFVRSHGVSPVPCTSSIGFTVVKNTACLPHMRLFLHGISPFLMIEVNSFAFPTWKMYSVNPFGNSTLSCNAGLIGRIWIHTILKSFPPFARVDIQSSSNHCEASSNFFFLHSSMMSLKWTAPSLPGRTD